MHARFAIAVVLTLARVALAGAPDFDAAAKEARALLEALVAADTTNPPGNESRAARIVAEILDDAKIRHEITEFGPGRENLVSRLGRNGAEGALLLLAHTDVVGTSGQQWSTDPHRVAEKDGYLVGRGVSDDLGMAAVATQVFLLLERSAVELDRDVILALTGDEESGGEGIRHLLREKPDSIRAAIAFNEGGGPRLDERGAVRILSLQVAEKTYADFEVTATGPTGHSSVPMPGNPIGRLGRALQRIGRHVEPPRLLPVTREYFGARAAVETGDLAKAMRKLAESGKTPPASALEVIERDPILAAGLRTTCIPTLVEGGTRVNALPASATASVNCRILPDETVDDAEKRLARLIDDRDVELRRTQDFGSGPPSPTDGVAIAAIRKVTGEMWPGVPVIPHMSLGATDSRFLRREGVAAYGLNPIALTDADSRRAHGIDERIPVASLRPAIELLYRLVVELAAKR
jgi:acetylornithine deacetylase/succinyl-diaminopimelate desuccinylase-like protein